MSVFKTGKLIQQRGFTRARRTENAAELAFHYVEVDSFQRNYGFPAFKRVLLTEILDVDHHLRFLGFSFSSMLSPPLAFYQ